MILGREIVRQAIAKNDVDGDPLPVVTFDGIANATLNSSTPLSNILDTSNLRESQFLTVPVRVDISGGTGEFAIEYDFGSFYTVRYCIVAGISHADDKNDDIDFVMEHSDDAVSWTPAKTVANSNVGGGSILEIGNVCLLLPSAISKRYWRIRFDNIDSFGSTQFFEIGYIAFYTELRSIPQANPQFNIIDANVQSSGISGTPFVVARQQYQTHEIEIPATDGNPDSILLASSLKSGELDRIAKASSDSGNFPESYYDPSANPVYGILYDEFDDGSNLGNYKCSMYSRMVIVAKDMTFAYENKPVNHPATSVRFREWR